MIITGSINLPGDKSISHRALMIASLSPQISTIKNLIFKNEEGEIIKTAKEELLDQDSLPKLPYQHLNSFYNLENYLSKTFLGRNTFSYHSSLGCPFTCSFCAVVPIYKGRWKAKSAESVYKDVLQKNIFTRKH